MEIKKEITRLEHSAVRLTATIPQADVAAGYNELLAKTAKSAQVPGFRKGKVPARILEQKYGEGLRTEAIGDLIDKALNEIFSDEAEKENRPLPYAQPQLEKMPDIDISKDLTFTVTYDVFPKVEVKDYNITVKEPQVTIGDKDLQDELRAIQERNAVVVDKKDGEAAEKDNIVTVDFHEIAADGTEIAGTRREDFTFTVGSGQSIYKFDDDVVGMKRGDTRQFEKSYAADDSNAELAGTTKKLSVTVKAVKIRNLPALDDDLAQDVNEKYKTLDDLKADIKKNLESAKENKIKEIKSNDLLSQLVEKNDFELPKSMVQAELDSRWRMMAQQFQTTTEQLEKMIAASGQSKEDMLREWTGDSEKMLKSRIIVDTLLREKNISVTPEEIEAEYARIAQGAGTTVDEVKKHYADPRAKEYLIDDTKEQKLYAELFGKVKVVKGDKISFADLFSK